MKRRFDGLTIVETEYLEELEATARSIKYIPDIAPIAYQDIVNIDTYKESFVRYLENARVSVARQRSTDSGNEAQLLGALHILSKLVSDVTNISKTRESYENKKEEEKQTKEDS